MTTSEPGLGRIWAPQPAGSGLARGFAPGENFAHKFRVKRFRVKTFRVEMFRVKKVSRQKVPRQKVSRHKVFASKGFATKSSAPGENLTLIGGRTFLEQGIFRIYGPYNHGKCP